MKHTDMEQKSADGARGRIEKTSVNVLFGPPANREDESEMLSRFFSAKGMHIICGGTTASLAAKHLDKPLEALLHYEDPQIPPVAHIDGVDLVTEGIVTLNKVLEYAEDYIGQNRLYANWHEGADGASRICRLLFESATAIHFFVGRAVNPAQQSPDFPVRFYNKIHLVEFLSELLTKTGKQVTAKFW